MGESKLECSNSSCGLETPEYWCLLDEGGELIAWELCQECADFYIETNPQRKLVKVEDTGEMEDDDG